MNQEHPKSSDSQLDNNSELNNPSESQKDTPQENLQSETKPEDKTAQSPKKEGTGFWSTVQSVLGAMFGVQSEEQREKDFEKGSAVQFIVGGIIFVVVFIVTILYFVNSIVEGSGAG